MRNYEYVNGRRVHERGFFARWGHRLVILMAIIGAFYVAVFIFGWGRSSSKVKNGGSREAIIAEEEKFHGIINNRLETLFLGNITGIINDLVSIVWLPVMLESFDQIIISIGMDLFYEVGKTGIEKFESSHLSNV